jgi:hypothetical protein
MNKFRVTSFRDARADVFDPNSNHIQFEEVTGRPHEFHVTPSNYSGGDANWYLYLLKVNVEESEKTGVFFKATVTWEYDPAKMYYFDPPEFEYDIAAVQEKQYIPVAMRWHRADQLPPLPFKGMGFDGDRVNGIVNESSQTKVICTFTAPIDRYNEPFINGFLPMVRGCVNDRMWRGFFPGGVLFEGAKFKRKNVTHPFDGTKFWVWEAVYRFDLQPMLQNVWFNTNSVYTPPSDNPNVIHPNDTGNPEPVPNPEYPSTPPPSTGIFVPVIYGHEVIEPQYVRQLDGSYKIDQINVYQTKRVCNLDWIGIPYFV